MSKSQDYLYAGKTDAVKEFNPKAAPFATVSTPRVVEFYSPLCVSFLLCKEYHLIIIVGKDSH